MFMEGCVIKMRRRITDLIRYWALTPLLLLSGCDYQHFWLFNPKGPSAGADLRYMIIDVAIMLGIIIPTGIMLAWAIWRYRRSSGKAKYDPKWAHSNAIEAVVWGIPLATLGVLAYFTYKGVFETNPYDPGAVTQSAAGATTPLEIDVISTDWRWLFVYPQQHIAAVDELVIPVHRPVRFRLTSTSVVNSFFIPQLVGQINAMPGMRTKQALIADKVGTYKGLSAEYSGDGFSWMQFQTHAVPPAQFEQWVKRVGQSPQQMTYAAFDEFAKPTINVDGKTAYFSGVQSGLFDHVVEQAMMGKVYPTPIGMTENMSASAKTSGK